jgi:hypothetical protein
MPGVQTLGSPVLLEATTLFEATLLEATLLEALLLLEATLLEATLLEALLLLEATVSPVAFIALLLVAPPPAPSRPGVSTFGAHPAAEPSTSIQRTRVRRIEPRRSVIVVVAPDEPRGAGSRVDSRACLQAIRASMALSIGTARARRVHSISALIRWVTTVRCAMVCPPRGLHAEIESRRKR